MSLTCKAGDTLTLSGVYLDPDSGAAQSLAGVTVRCELVRGSARVVTACTITDEDAGTFTASATAGTTAGMAVGLWRGDVQFSAAGVVTSGRTFSLEILEDVTGAAD